MNRRRPIEVILHSYSGPSQCSSRNSIKSCLGLAFHIVSAAADRIVFRSLYKFNSTSDVAMKILTLRQRRRHIRWEERLNWVRK